MDVNTKFIKTERYTLSQVSVRKPCDRKKTSRSTKKYWSDRTPKDNKSWCLIPAAVHSRNILK